MSEFRTESGQRFAWSEKQVKHYRGVRAILAPKLRAGTLTEEEAERQAIEAAATWAGPAVAGAEQNAGSQSPEPEISPAAIYARRNEPYAASLQRAPGPRADSTTPAPEAPAEASDVYARRAAVYRSAAARGIS